MSNKKSTLKLNSAISIICFATVFALIFAEHYLCIITLPSAVYTALSVLVFLLLKLEFATQYFIMLVPFAGAVHIKEIALFYLTIVLFKSWFAKKDTRLKAGTLLSFLIILGLQLIATVRCNDKIQTVIYLAFVMGCVVYWSMTFFDEDRSVVFLKSYLFSLVCMVLFIIILTIKLVPAKQLFNGFVRLGEDSYFEVEAFHTGANGLGMMCLYGSSIICFLISRKKINKILAFLGIVILLSAGIMTQSRAFIFGCVFILLYLMLFYAKSLLRNLKILAIVGVMAVVVITIMNHFYPNILLHFMDRFSTDDITNGRTDIFGAYLKSWYDDPISLLFGAGLLTYPSVLGSEVNNISSHNATQEVLLAWGLIGLIAMVVWFVSLTKSRGISHCMSSKMRALFPMLTLIFMVQSTRIFSTYNSIFLIGIALFCITPLRTERD